MDDEEADNENAIQSQEEEVEVEELQSSYEAYLKWGKPE